MDESEAGQQARRAVYYTRTGRKRFLFLGGQLREVVAVYRTSRTPDGDEFETYEVQTGSGERVTREQYAEHEAFERSFPRITRQS